LTDIHRPSRSSDAASTAGSTYDPRGKTPEDIEHDIAETRAEMASALNVIQSRFSPQQLLAQGIDALQHSVSGNAAPMVRASAAGLAFSSAVIGLGVFLLLRSMVKPPPLNEHNAVAEAVPMLTGPNNGREKVRDVRG